MINKQTKKSTNVTGRSLLLAIITEHVNHEVSHLYILHQMISTADINTFYLVNIETRLN